MEYTFNNGFQSDDQIINQSTYTLSLDMDTLLDNSQTSAERFQRGELSRPPKWLNEFILYRKDKMASPEFKNRIAENKRAGNVSKEIGDLWDTEPEHVKLFFRALARKAKQRHSKNYGQRTENELESAEEQVYPIDQTFIEQSQHSFNYIQDNNTQYLLFAHPVLSSPNLNPDGPISFEYYPSAQQAHDYPSWNGGNETAQETHDLVVTAGQQEYYYPSWVGGNETAQETHDLIVTAGQQGYYYPSWNGGNETAQETHDMIVTAAQQGYSCPFGEEINGTAQETHDLIVTAAQQGYYCPFWDEIDGIAQETHDLIVTAGQQGYYYPSWNGGNETAQETHDLIVTAGQQGYYYPSWNGGNETAQETHDLIVTAVQRY